MVRKQRNIFDTQRDIYYFKRNDPIASLPKNPRLKFDGDAFGGRADRHKRFVAGIYVEMHKGSTTR